ncbi:MAG: DUF2961 domain-containing protein [Phycisphaerae bacterium]|nr:DUF2961 domain-containing protein [Phycisphaerae bacterium]
MLLGLLWLAGAFAPAGDLDDLARPQEGRSRRATSSHRRGPDGKYDPHGELDPDSNSDNQSVPPGVTKVLLDEQGPGVITHIWMTFLGPEPQDWAKNGSANHQEMLLRIYYDGRERPGVEAPVGDFFANGFGQRRAVISVPVVVEDADSYNCFWRMPFRKSIRIEIVNESEKPISLLYYNIDWIKLNTLPDDTPYFYAQYRQEYPVVGGRDYLILETQGKGHYVGTVLSVRTRSPSWFGEGDEKIYIDGESKASIWGTGTEDYFLSAWGLQTTSTPYFGTPYFDQWGVVGSRTCAYRWHIHDPLVFNTGIKVTIEHYGWISPDENPEYKTHSWNERQDDYSSVAFWYQQGEPTFAARAPHARDRTLPNLDTIFYAADVPGGVRHGDGVTEVQQLLGYTKGQVLYRPSQVANAWIEIPFTVEEKAPFRLLLNMTRSNDFGQYQATLNGVKLGGPLDFYKADTDNWEYHLLDFWPDPGEYVLRLECVGKHNVSTGYYLGIESVRLRERRPRVLEWGHEKDHDWRQGPKLYQ